MPSLGLYLRHVREHLRNSRTGRPISRETAARRIGLSAAYLTQIERGLRIPSPQALQLLTLGYDLSPAQTRHISELRAPPIPVPDAIRQPGTAPAAALTDRLISLHRGGVLAGYFDPFWNLLAANAGMCETFEGLEQAANLVVWHFTSHARAALPDWSAEAAAMVSALKPAVGTHRRSAGARKVLAELRGDPDFRHFWTHDITITYHRDPATPLHIRHHGEIRHLDVETSIITDPHSYTRLFHAVTAPPI